MRRLEFTQEYLQLELELGIDLHIDYNDNDKF